MLQNVKSQELFRMCCEYANLKSIKKIILIKQISITLQRKS
jgi:hypothetical protein